MADALGAANERPSPPSSSKMAEGDGRRSSGLEEDMNGPYKDSAKKMDVVKGLLMHVNNTLAGGWKDSREW